MWFARDPPMSSNRYLCGIFISATLNLADRGEILTFPDTLTTQGLSLHVLEYMVFEHSGGRDFDLPRHSHYSGVIPMVFEQSADGSASGGGAQCGGAANQSGHVDRTPGVQERVSGL